MHKFTSYKRLNLSEPARAIIDRVRTKPISSVGHGPFTMQNKYASQKMGHIVNVASTKLQLPYVVELEYNPDVLAYWDRPAPIKVAITLASGRAHTVVLVPSFLVLYRDRVAWLEIKQEKELRRLAQAAPGRYIIEGQNNSHLDQDCKPEAEGFLSSNNIPSTEFDDAEDLSSVMRPTQWRCPGAEAYAARLGFRYEVKSSSQINWNIYSNLMYMERYVTAARSGSKLHLHKEVARTLIRAVERQQGITVNELRQSTEAEKGVSPDSDQPDERNDPRLGEVADAINILILRRELYMNLSKERLADPDHAHIYTDEHTAMAYTLAHSSKGKSNTHGVGPSLVDIQPGAKVIMNGEQWVIIEVTEDGASMVSEGGTTFKATSPQLLALIDAGTLTGVSQQRTAQATQRVKDILLHASPQDMERANRRFQIIMPVVIHGAKKPESDIPKSSWRR